MAKGKGSGRGGAKGGKGGGKGGAKGGKGGSNRNLPSRTGNPSGHRRGNNPPKSK